MMAFRPLLASLLTTCALLVCAPAPAIAGPAASTSAWPTASVYNLNASLVDQDGQALSFASTTGKPRLVTMFYSSCKFVCPLIIDTLRKTEHELPDSSLKGLDVLMVSFDPDNDTPAKLKALAEQRHLDTPRWRLARAAAPDVRRIAAVLGIQYRQLENHEFSHSSVLVLLDAHGRIVARSERLGQVDPEFVAAIKQALEPAS